MNPTIDFYASQAHYIHHQLPVWEMLGNWKGTFYVAPSIYAEARFLVPECKVLPLDDFEWNDYMLVSGYSDIQLVAVRNKDVKIIYLDHGVGFAFPHPAYAGYQAGTGGYRDQVSLFLTPNKTAWEFIRNGTPDIPQVIVGTPKMDKWACEFVPKSSGSHVPTATISFHWAHHHVHILESGSAVKVYENNLKDLVSDKFHIQGHAHPRSQEYARRLYEKNGITEFLPYFDEVMCHSDVYVADATSTLYEFLCTGRPIVFLNDPKWNRKVDYGARFWRFTDCGVQVDNPAYLLDAVQHALFSPYEFVDQRYNAVRELYPYMGKATHRAVLAIIDYIETGTSSMIE